jgi:hypothetical protein
MPPLKIWTVVGLVDEEECRLYVAAVFPGKREAQDTTLVTTVEGYGDLSRFVGYFDAEDGNMAEEIATDVVSHYADYDAELWSAQRPPRPYIEDVKTDKV